MTRLFTLSFCVFLMCATASAAETWVKIKSPHFTVISNDGEKQAREVATGFEQIHSIFTLVLPGLRTDASADTVVLALKDEKTFTDLLPADKKSAARVAGLFREGWEKDYVIVRLDFPDQARDAEYHEYIHKLLHLNYTRLPLWVDEGLAEFFGNTTLLPNDIVIGAPSPRLRELESGTVYPIGTVLSVNHNSPYYHDGDKVGMFYAEPWGLTHMLMLGDNMGRGQKMATYLKLLQQNANSEATFEQVFGKIDDLQQQFDTYVHRFLFPTLHTNKALPVDSSTFAGGPMSVAETDARLGGFYNYIGSIESANQILTAALAADPKSALAHENMGVLDFRQGKDDEAAKEFDQAASLDPSSYLAVYYQAMLKYHDKSDAESLSKLDSAIGTVLQLNPRFAPALIVRSEIYVKQGKMQDALNAAVQAQNLEPDRAGYLTHVAAILLAGHNYAEAIKWASGIAERWDTTDSAEALAVLAQARKLSKVEPTAAEQTEETADMKYAEGTTAVEGVVKSVTCEESKPQQLVLQSGGQDLNFVASGPHGVGFSDTTWYGADHFSTCHHIEGMNAVVRYTSSTDQTATKQIKWLELRDQLIPSSLPPAAD